MLGISAFCLHKEPVPAAHSHLHDNDGTEDSHAVTSEGTIDFSQVMAEIRKSGVTNVIKVATR